MSFFASMISLLGHRQTVRQLRRLDDHMLRDIGLSRHDVDRMAAF